MISRHLKSGGVFLVTCIDSDVFADKLKREANTANAFGNDAYTMMLESKGPVQPYNARFRFTPHDEDAEEDEHEENLVFADALTSCAKAAGLTYVDYGHLNFHEVATYLKKQHQITWQQLQDHPEQCELMGMYSTLVYRKE